MAEQERVDSLSNIRRAPKPPPRKGLRRTIAALTAATLIAAAYIVGANIYMTSSTASHIYATPAELPPSTQADAIVILGAGVRANGEPTDALHDRLQTGLTLWEQGAAPVVVVSGDNSDVANYQVDVMASWLEDRGVPETAITRDTGGLNTYDTMSRASHVYGLDSVIAVSQEFHLARCVYNGEQQGMDVIGVAADLRPYEDETRWQIREWGARAKDLIVAAF
ncbi:MAG: SanA/YdcF family protein [Ancrocorticia sp.]|uniref:SanA/YdcF family protein n=1 Tax=Ancrocorticia sp. TaxID=2593684 RepID=UPI003F8DE80C